MLVFLSDLHFVDGTAGKHNVPANAFEGVLSDLKKYGPDKTGEIKIVFLGDIFDILRTTYWLEVDESERPWGDTENKAAKIEEHANRIFDKIVAENKRTFDLFAGSLKDTFGYPVEPERIYVPGNHDRLCNMFDSLRVKVRQNLGMAGATGRFSHVFDDSRYGGEYRVFARHGHEYDVWNYEGTANLTDSDYEMIPIGDLITTELVARLPYTIMKHVGTSIPPDERDHLRRNLEDIENVRPMSAIIDWIFYQVRENPGLKEQINEAVREVVDTFEGLAYLQRWYARHDKWNLLTLDEADKIQDLIKTFKFFSIDSAEVLLKLYSRIFGSPDSMPVDNSDRILVDAASDFLSHTSDYSYMVMGHTHNPLQIPVRITSAGWEQYYLNTGTWRQRYTRSLAGHFMGMKYLTYVTFYSRKESPDQFFETWSGSLKE